MKSKFARIEELRRYGLNTPDNKQIAWIHDLENFDFKKAESWSIRTIEFRTTRKFWHQISNRLKDLLGTEKFRLDKGYPPHIYACPQELAYKITEYLLRTGFVVVICPGIDIKDCELAGAILKTKTGMIAEIKFGPHSVRDVTVKGQIDKVYDSTSSDIDKRVKEAFDAIQNIPLQDVILEFSYYKIPIGWANKNLIFWDYLPYNKYSQQLVKQRQLFKKTNNLY